MRKSTLWNIGKLLTLATGFIFVASFAIVGGAGFLGIAGLLATVAASGLTVREMEQRREKAWNQEFKADQDHALEQFEDPSQTAEVKAKALEDSHLYLKHSERLRDESGKSFFAAAAATFISAVFAVAAAATGLLPLGILALISLSIGFVAVANAGHKEHLATDWLSKASHKATTAQGKDNYIVKLAEERKQAGVENSLTGNATINDGVNQANVAVLGNKPATTLDGLLMPDTQHKTTTKVMPSTTNKKAVSKPGKADSVALTHSKPRKIAPTEKTANTVHEVRTHQTRREGEPLNTAKPSAPLAPVPTSPPLREGETRPQQTSRAGASRANATPSAPLLHELPPVAPAHNKNKAAPQTLRPAAVTQETTHQHVAPVPHVAARTVAPNAQVSHHLALVDNATEGHAEKTQNAKKDTGNTAEKEGKQLSFRERIRQVGAPAAIAPIL